MGGGGLSELRATELTQTPALHTTQQSGGQSNEYCDRAPGSGLRPDRGSGDHVRDRQAREAGGRRSRRPQWRDDGARDGSRTARGPRRRGLLPADDRRRGADVRRRQDPGRLLQAGGPRQRARHPDRTHDRPPDPAALAEGVPQRGAGDLHRALCGSRHAARHPVHQRRVRVADDLAAAVLRSRRGRPDRPDRRRARRQPDAPAELDRDGDGPDRRRHEGRPDDGRGRRGRGARGRAPRGARARARRDPQAVRRAGRPAPPGGQGEVARQRPHRRDRGDPRAHDLGAHPERRAARGGDRRRRAHRPSWPARSRWTRPRRTSSARRRCVRA